MAAPVVTLTAFQDGGLTTGFELAEHNGSRRFFVKIEFDQDVTGLEATTADLGFVNCLLSDLRTSVNFGSTKRVWRITVTGISENNDATITIKAGAAMNAAGEVNAETSLTVPYDTGPPTASFDGPSFHNNLPFVLDIDWSKRVTGFAVSDIDITGGTVNWLLATPGGQRINYSASITPEAIDKDVVVSLQAGVVTGADGSGNSLAASRTITKPTKPTVAITAPATHDGATKFTATITFSEAVTGFTDSDIIVSFGTKSNFRANTGTANSWQIDITPFGSNITIGILISASSVDGAQSGNLEGRKNVTFASTAPTDATKPTITYDGPQSHTGVAFELDIDFSEPVINFGISDVTVVGGASSGLIRTPGGQNRYWKVDITPTDAGTDCTISIANGACTDAAGNEVIGKAVTVTARDTTAPTVTIVSPNANHDGSTKFRLTATFSEAVTGFILGDLRATNCTIDNFQGSGTTYTFDVTPTNTQTLSVELPANSAHDADNNGNTRTSTSVPYQAPPTTDTVRPTVGLAGARFHDGVVFDLDINFSEDISGFTLSDISVVNGTASNLARSPSGQNRYWQVDITPTAANVTVEVSIPDNAVQDAADNGNVRNSTAIAPRTQTGRPTVVLTSATQYHGNTSFRVTATFSENVAGLTLAGILTTFCSVSNLQGSGSAYTFDVSPFGQVAITVRIPDGAVQDSDGNGNLAGVLTVDYQAPIPTDPDAPSDPLSPLYLLVTGRTVEASDRSDVDYACEVILGRTRYLQVKLSAAPDENIDIEFGPTAVLASAERGGLTATPATLSFTPLNWNTLRSIQIGTSELTITSSVEFIFFLRGTAAGQTFSTHIALLVRPPSSVNLPRLSGGQLAPDAKIRWAIDGALLSTDAPDAVEFEMDQAWQGSVVYRDTAWHFLPGGVSAPKLALTKADVIEVVRCQVGPDSQDRINAGSLSLGADERRDYLPRRAPKVVLQDALEVDGARRETDLGTRAFIAKQEAARRALAIALRRVRIPAVFVLRLLPGEDLANLALQPGDIVTYTDSRYSVFGERARVVSSTINTDMSATVALNAEPASIFDQVAQDSAAVDPLATDVTPELTLIPGKQTHDGVGTVAVTALFNTPVIGFDVTDISVEGGAISAFRGDDGSTAFTFIVTPDSTDPIELFVAGGAATSIAGTSSQPARLDIGFVPGDTTRPTVAIEATPETHGGTGVTITATITFSEPVSGFTAADISVTGGTKGAFAGSGAVYTLQITPTGTNHVVISVAEGVAQDGAGNTNTAAVDEQVNYVAPNPTLSRFEMTGWAFIPAIPVAGITAHWSGHLNIEWDRPVTGFTRSDIELATTGTAVLSSDDPDINGNLRIGVQCTVQNLTVTIRANSVTARDSGATGPTTDQVLNVS